MLARQLREYGGLDLHQSAIARLERGERAIRLNEAAALAYLFGLDLRPFGSSVPQLTPEEYEQALKDRDALFKEELALRNRLEESRGRYLEDQFNIDNESASVRERRLLLDRAINLYRKHAERQS